MSTKDYFILTRSGDFAFKTVGDKHCGMARPGQMQECRYVIRVKASGHSLDASGYLFEQLRVQEYFDKIKAVRSTCELLVRRVASELEDMIVKENRGIEIKWIEVTLAAAPYAASMTFKFHP